MPGDTGGDFYRDNISGCNTSTIPMNSPMVQEPGNMMGPTVQGVQMLIDQDPTAYWDGSKVVSPLGKSPRIFPIPLYDPVYYATGKANGRNADFKLANVLGFFVERTSSGNQVYGRVTPIIGTMDGSGGPAPAGSFATAIRLVQ